VSTSPTGTGAGKVAAFIDRFFSEYPGWSELAAAEELELQERLRPLGLHRRRASVLRRLAASVLDQPYLALEDRPGVGQYISRAVAVSLFGASDAMVDVNFVRVLHRAFDGPWKADYRHDRRLQALAAAVVSGANDPRSVNWAILDLVCCLTYG